MTPGDVRKALLLFLGTSQPSAKQVQRFANTDAANMLIKLLGSDSLRGTTWSALIAGYDSPRRREERLTVSLADADWAYALLGLARPSKLHDTGSDEGPWRWSAFLIEYFTDPRVVRVLRAAGDDQGMLDQLAPLASSAPMPHWCAFLHVVLLGRLLPEPMTGAHATLAGEATAILASDAFRDTVLSRLGSGGPLPHELLWTRGPRWPFRAYAEQMLLMRDGLDLVGSGGKDDWARFLLRLLVNEDTLFTHLLGLDAELIRPLAEAKPAEAGDQIKRGLSAASEAVAAARAGRAQFDPLVGSPLFATSSTGEIVIALHRLCLMSEPNPAWVPAAKGLTCDAVVRGLIRSVEFRSKVLDPLRAGRLPEAALGGSLAGSVALLAPLFGLAEQDPERDLDRSCGEEEALEGARRLLIHPNFAAVAGSDPVPTAIDAYVVAALGSLALLSDGHGSAPSVRVGIDVGADVVVTLESDLPSERAVALFIRGVEQPDAAACLPAAAEGPQSILLSVPLELARGEDGMFAGALVLTEAEGAAITIPLLQAISEEAIVEARANDARNLDRALAQAQRGTGDPVALLNASIGIGAPRAAVLAAIADILASRGDREQAEATLARARASDPDIMLIDVLHARLMMADGRFADAAARFDTIARHSDLAPLDHTLHGAARLAAGQAVAPHTFAGEALPQWFVQRLLAQITAPDVQLGWFAAGVKGMDGGAVDKIVARLIDAMAAVYQTGERVGGTLLKLQRSGLASPAALYAKAAEERTAHRLLPALSYLRPDTFNDLRLLITLARIAQGQEDRTRALGFAEQALSRDLNHHEALVLAGAIYRQLKRPEEAIAVFRRALSIKPDEERTIERLIELEADAVARDPLRGRQELTHLQSSLALRAERRIFTNPTNEEARFGFARSCISLHRYDDARVVLEGLGVDADVRRRVRSELLRIAVHTADHERALAIASEMLSEGFAERPMLAAVRALRALGQFQEAQTLLERHLDADNEMVRREFVRGHFYLAEFEDAARQADEYLELQPDDLDLRLLAAAAYLELGLTRQAGYHVYYAERNGGADAFPLEMPLYSCALAGRAGKFATSIRQLDRMFAQLDVQPVRYDRSLGDKPFDQLVGAGAIDDGIVQKGMPLVSVIMTTYNAQDYVGTAIRSILSQTYPNIELIVVDDASSDATPAILESFERQDPRVRAILKTTNDGTYVSKNIGLLQAQGEYVALQDSDDWSHPERIAKAVGTLIEKPDLVGLTTDWIRMTTDGEVVIKGGGQIAHLCCISLVFRRVPVLQKVGSFDSVRIAADLEFIQRIGLSFGAEAVPRLRWPLLFGRARSDSLTASEEFGLSRTGFSAPRQAYHEGSKLFHWRIMAGASPSIPFPLVERLFPAPGIILPLQTTE
jgi:tetratricopeptide (TPR) repeat protein